INPSIISSDIESVTQMINEVDDALTMMRFKNIELGGITDIKGHIKRAEIGSMLGVAEFNEIKSMLNRKRMLSNVFDEFEEDEVELSYIHIYINGLPDVHYLYKRISET